MAAVAAPPDLGADEFESSESTACNASMAAPRRADEELDLVGSSFNGIARWSKSEHEGVLEEIVTGLSVFKLSSKSVSLNLQQTELQICVTVFSRKAVAQLVKWIETSGEAFGRQLATKFSHLGVDSSTLCVLRDR